MSEQLINADNRPLPSPTPGQTFAQGALFSLPLIVAAIPFAIVYGALGEALQLSFWLVIAISMFVFAGASHANKMSIKVTLIIKANGNA